MLSVGRIYCDLVFAGLPHLPRAGTEIFAERLTLHAGGGAFASAAAFAAEGGRAEVAGYLPAAPFDAVVRKEAARCKLGLTHAASAPEGTDPQITAALPVEGERAFVTRAPGQAVPPLRAEDLAGVRHLHFGEARSLVDHADLIAFARQAGASISADCAWDEALDPQALAPLLAALDLFLPNKDEVALLRGLGLDPFCAPLTVVKQGGAGATLYGPCGEIHRPATPRAACDTTGAGDAFNGGFLAAWLAGATHEASLDAGNRCGAAAVMAFGATGWID